ncbi:MAG TPA: class I SAM-dependent methyltransferase [Phycisphaerae bacterium]|nr:class I SAM-dependent methyltransferase [Phycisphaerae bacterium]
MNFRNTYQDTDFAAAYAKLEFPGTYYLAFRDLPGILARHVAGRTALDFGCGAGRSTRFLRQLGFDTVGVDIAEEMIRQARATDPAGDYRQIADGDLSTVPAGTFDLVLSAFPFDNIPTWAGKVRLFREMARMLKLDGRIVNLVSSPEIYWHEWASFSTKQFPENRRAKCGDPVRIINTAIGDSRPTVDILWPHDDYLDVYRAGGLQMVEVRRPLGRVDEPYDWVNETRIAPWVIYVLEKTKT